MRRNSATRATARWATKVLSAARAVTIGDMAIAEDRAEAARREFWLALEMTDFEDDELPELPEPPKETP